MLSGVPGLLTFTMVSDGETERTLELPTLVHDMVGSGLPDALQLNDMLLPSFVTSAEVETLTDGATKMKIDSIQLNDTVTVRLWRIQFNYYKS